MKEVLQLCNRLLDDPNLSEENKRTVRQFAYWMIVVTTRKSGGNLETLESIL